MDFYHSVIAAANSIRIIFINFITSLIIVHTISNFSKKFDFIKIKFILYFHSSV